MISLILSGCSDNDTIVLPPKSENGDDLSIELPDNPTPTFTQPTIHCPKDMVKITPERFCIDTYEVSIGAYQTCVSQGQCDQPAYSRSLTRQIYYNDPGLAQHPIIQVDWYNAQKYCQFVDKRLPSGAEWDRVAFGPQTNYSWPTDAILQAPADTQPTNSGKLSITPEGIYGLYGNVKEWVADDLGVNNAVRGKSFMSESSDPVGYLPETTSWDIGFRCAKDSP